MMHLLMHLYLSLRVCVCVCACHVRAQSLSCVRLFVIPWTVAHQAPLPMEFPRKNTGVVCHFPGIKPRSLASPALEGRFFTISTTWEAIMLLLSHFSRVRLYATPETAAHQAPLSLGFSRQEHWSGLPFPSPMHQSEK